MTPRSARFDAWRARPGRETLVALLEASQGRVYAICQEILRHRQDAEEAAQETLLEILVGIDRVRDSEHYESWIKTVAFRTALDRKKLRSRRRLHELNGMTGSRPDEAPFEVLHDALERLDEEDRALLVERYFDRKTFEEMGRSRGLSDVGVRKRVAKAQDRLKRMLGCALPGGLWKGAFTVGVAAMKTKTAAGLAVILLPLLLLGGGVWVASARRSPAPWAAPPAGTTGSPKVAAFLSESRAPASAAAEPADALIQAKVPIHRAQIRAEIVTTLERRRYVGRRSAECKELWPEASTEEEGRALQREKVALDKEWGPLGGKLKELAASDPANIVEMVRSAHDLPERLQLMGLIAPDVNSEIATEESLSGPLLAGLLSLAHGETEEKMYFAAFAGKLTRANRELGQALLTLMADSDFHVSKHAGQALWALADQGALKEFFKGQIPALKQAALRQGEELDYQYVGTPLKILASIGADEADVFVLHRFETIESRNDYETITAVLISASRIAGRHEARLVLAILRALELPGQPYMHENLLRVAEHLPPEKLANIARVVDGKGWPSNPNYLPRVMVAGNRRDRQVYRSMIGVSRWQLKMAPDSPGIHRHR